MAKTNVAEASAKGAGGGDGDAPLIDLNDAGLKKLIARAKKRGYLTFDELNEALPQDQIDPDKYEDIMAALNEMGVNIVENEDAGEDEKPQDQDDGDEEQSSDDGSGEVFQVEKKKETVDRTDDPVRMYLREM